MYKIAIYSICKNELDNVESWYDSAKQADEIYILDTGSTDGTLEKLKSLAKEHSNFHLYEKSYETFSFSDAWNTILDKVSKDTDFVFRLDMDQYICNRYWYFELQLFLMNLKINQNKSYSINTSIFEKNFSRIDTTGAISSTNVRWDGVVHERNYFPDVHISDVVLTLAPLTIFHNQKYPSTSGTGVAGCQKKYEFYTHLSEEQFLMNKTVFNFIEYSSVKDDLLELLNYINIYALEYEEFEQCKSETTSYNDFKPQLVNIMSAIIYTYLANRCLENYFYNEEQNPLNLHEKETLPYISTTLDRLCSEISLERLRFNRFKSFKELLEVEDESVQDLLSRISYALSNYKHN